VTEIPNGNWQGNEALRPLLVPVEALAPHPRNPRRGVTDQIADSLRRFGQQRPVLALPDGTLVAGHHVWMAARAAGWSHVAVVRSDLTDAEVDAYLLADNRLSDLGLYDDDQLAELLAPLAASDGLDGLGYSASDVAALLQLLAPPDLVPQEKPPAAVAPGEQPYALGTADLYRIVLSYDVPTYRLVVARLDALADAHGLDSYSAVVRFALLGEAADAAA